MAELIIDFREELEASPVVGVLYVFLNKTGKKAVIICLLPVVIGSLFGLGLIWKKVADA